MIPESLIYNPSRDQEHSQSFQPFTGIATLPSMIFRKEMDFPQLTKEIQQQWFHFVEQNQEGWQLLGWEWVILTNSLQTRFMELIENSISTIYSVRPTVIVLLTERPYPTVLVLITERPFSTVSVLLTEGPFSAVHVTTLPDIILTRPPPLFSRISLGRKRNGLLAVYRFLSRHLKNIWLSSVDREKHKRCHSIDTGTVLCSSRL